MDEVQIIPFSGRTLTFNYEGAAQVRFPSSEQGFLLGQENRSLKPLIQEIVEGKISPDRQPVLLYGVPGTGRTHLLKGMLETWRKNQTNNSIRRQSYYSTCADFHRHYTEAVATKMTGEFRRRYCRAKLLLLDDIEQLFGKHAAQMELRLLLDEFATGEGIVVITAQVVPNDMVTGNAEPLSTHLTVRLQGGTMVSIAPPGEAVRRQFLRNLALALRIPVEESAVDAAAKELTGTIPQLYAAVAQKYMEAKAANEPLTSAFWQQFSKRRQPRRSQNLPEIAKRTATYFALKLSDLKGEPRCKTVALARRIAVYLAKSQLNLTYKEIGHFFGKRDPSTVRYLFETVERDLQMVPEIRDHLFRLTMQDS